MGEDELSDYGSDFTPEEEKLLHRYLDQTTKDVIEVNGSLEPSNAMGIAPLFRPPGLSQKQPPPVPKESPATRDITVESAQNAVDTMNADSTDDTRQAAATVIDTSQELTPDLVQQPQARFRTARKKYTLSVTDLVSPAWCELQYFFSLATRGKIRRTPQMKQGSSMHREIEEKHHTFVPVVVFSKEDRFGLRLFNMIQGWQALRTTGITREMEVVGIFEDQVVHGVIDELTMTCPVDDDSQHPDHISGSLFTQNSGPDPFSSANGARTLTDALSALSTQTEPISLQEDQRPPRVYVLDTKSRGGRSLPSGSALLGTQMQLMLYHRMLSNLAFGNVDPHVVFERNSVVADRRFTDEFIESLGNEDESASSFLTECDTPLKLWTAMCHAVRSVLTDSEILSPLLTAEYISRDTQLVMGKRHFTYDTALLDSYLNRVLRVWRGDCEPRGVEIEDAHKCRSCEFAERCVWRKQREAQPKQKASLTS